jgi:serine/threonine protein kinase
VRTRALTLPPTDELRQLVERSEGATMPPELIEMAGGDITTETPVRRPGSIGRRSSDRGDDPEDRRRQADRRAGRVSAPTLDRGAGAGAAALAHSLDTSDEAEPDLIGAEVDGRYRVIELIGEGGMGKVYLAEHVEIGKRVALKVLHPSYSRMPDLVERFRREARAASKIGHPNIVDVTDSGTTTDGSVYFVMEYLEGVELGSVIEREGAIDVARALRIAGQICRALAAAHAQGIVHRDLKPENIFLITRDGAADVVKVLDFGIAKTTEAEAARERRLTSPGMAMGTPEYMAPEQAAGRAADSRCDVYALGAIMYEMVTGVPPYTGDNFMEILTKKATLDPTPPVLVRADLPAQVSELVMAAMARNPDARPQTMETLEYELNKCLAGRGVAVAQILGMTTDANVVATLNPGLSMRNLDDGSVLARASSPVAVQRGPTHSGQLMLPAEGVFSGPTVSTGQNLLQTPRLGSEPAAAVVAVSGRMQSQPAASPRMQSQPAVAPAQSMIELPPYETPSIKRSGLGVFGWLLLAALLFGGVGALLYVALGERGDRAPSKLDEAVQPPPRVGGIGSAEPAEPAPPPPNPPNPPRPGGAPLKVDPPDEPAGPDAQVAPDDPDRKADVRRPRQTIKRQPPVDERDPKALLKQGKAHEKSGDWEAARTVYQKLEKIKGYAGIALYQQAWVAINMNDTDAAMQLATRSAGHPGTHKTDAKFLYGDALFKQGQHKRARDIYIGLRKTLTGELKATATRKIAAANRALKLPEDDGIGDD